MEMIFYRQKQFFNAICRASRSWVFRPGKLSIELIPLLEPLFRKGFDGHCRSSNKGFDSMILNGAYMPNAINTIFLNLPALVFKPRGLEDAKQHEEKNFTNLWALVSSQQPNDARLKPCVYMMKTKSRWVTGLRLRLHAGAGRLRMLLSILPCPSKQNTLTSGYGTMFTKSQKPFLPKLACNWILWHSLGNFPLQY